MYIRGNMDQSMLRKRKWYHSVPRLPHQSRWETISIALGFVTLCVMMGATMIKTYQGFAEIQSLYGISIVTFSLGLLWIIPFLFGIFFKNIPKGFICIIVLHIGGFLWGMINPEEALRAAYIMIPLIAGFVITPSTKRKKRKVRTRVNV